MLRKLRRSPSSTPVLSLPRGSWTARALTSATSKAGAPCPPQETEHCERERRDHDQTDGAPEWQVAPSPHARLGRLEAGAAFPGDFERWLDEPDRERDRRSEQ